jgi:hypothetical protein
MKQRTSRRLYYRWRLFGRNVVDAGKSKLTILVAVAIAAITSAAPRGLPRIRTTKRKRKRG